MRTLSSSSQRRSVKIAITLGFALVSALAVACAVQGPNEQLPATTAADAGAGNPPVKPPVVPPADAAVSVAVDAGAEAGPSDPFASYPPLKPPSLAESGTMLVLENGVATLVTLSGEIFLPPSFGGNLTFDVAPNGHFFIQLDPNGVGGLLGAHTQQQNTFCQLADIAPATACTITITRADAQGAAHGGLLIEGTLVMSGPSGGGVKSIQAKFAMLAAN